VTESELDRDVQRVRRLARVLDTAIEIPVIRVRLGADALLGLFPGAGDALSAGLAAYPVIVAVRHRLPRTLVVRLLGNIALDAIVGTVPLIGDLFDIGFKANVRNHRLLVRYAEQPVRAGRESRVLLWLAIGAMILLITALAALSVWIVGKGLAVITG
jgi:hypothetical protein